MSTPLMGPAEKRELEKLILALLDDQYQRFGGSALLAPGLILAVTGDGPILTHRGQAEYTWLANVEVRTLFTAVCYLAGDSPEVSVPHDALGSLATEATSAAAAQINKLAL